MTTFVVFLNNGRTLSHKRVLSPNEFIYIASGKWPSIYNPQRRNYFEERQLDCGIFQDTYSLKETSYCIPFDSLWKIRFSTYPYRSSTEPGWSSKLYRPSVEQEVFLYNTYGVRNIDTEFFLDTSFWKLMNDVMDPVWIANYKSLQ